MKCTISFSSLTGFELLPKNKKIKKKREESKGSFYQNGATSLTFKSPQTRPVHKHTHTQTH